MKKILHWLVILSGAALIVSLAVMGVKLFLLHDYNVLPTAWAIAGSFVVFTASSVYRFIATAPKCSHCGKTVWFDHPNCPYCGAKLENTDEK